MGNRELDKWIAKKVMDGKRGYWPPKYTTFISDAFQVVEKMIEDGIVGYFEVCRYADLETGDKQAWVVFNGQKGRGFNVETEANTAALAICLAAKKAIEGEPK